MDSKPVKAFGAFYLCIYAGIACMGGYLNVFLETCRGRAVAAGGAVSAGEGSAAHSCDFFLKAF